MRFCAKRKAATSNGFSARVRTAPKKLYHFFTGLKN
jgi:hypothetical protein